MRSPVSVLFSTDGVEVPLKDNVALPTDARGFIGVGVDGGGNTQFVLVDTSGRYQIVGAAAEGAATAGNPLLIAGTDGTNARTPHLFDADSGAGAQYVLGVVLRKSASGGSVELGTSSDPVRTDPTGTTTQPISGTVSATQGTAAGAAAPWAVRLSDGSSFYSAPTAAQLPSSLVGGRLDSNIGAWLGSTAPTVGSKTSANSIPVVIASDQATVSVQTEAQIDYDTGGGTQNLSVIGIALPASGGAVAGGTATNPIRTDPTGTTTQPVSGTVTSNQGTAAGAAAPWSVRVSDGGSFVTVATDRTTAAAPFAVRLSDGSAFYVAPTAAQLPSSLVGGRLDANIGAWLGSTAPTVGSKTSANSIPVVVASDQGAITTSPDTGATTGTAVPSKANYVGGSDGTNIQGVRVFDADTGGGTQYVLGVALRKSASGGSVELGTSSDPVRTDPTGTTTQPVSGTVTANQGTAAAATAPWAVRASDGSAFISVATDRTTAAGPFSTRLSDGSAFYDAAKTGQLPSALVGGRLDINIGAWLGSTAPTVGQKTMANSMPVTLASDQSAVTANPTRSGTGTSSNVGSSASVVTLLASNSSRLGATVFNDSNQNLFLKLGSAASLTSFTVRVTPNGYYEVPYSYTGIITGIWSSANGNARVTELTA